MNVYGTKEYEEYVKRYRESINGYQYVKTNKQEDHFEMNGIHFDIMTYDYHAYEDENAAHPWYHTIFYEITITLKNGQKKTYHTIDHGCKPQVFHYQNVDYIFMRKTLYGYCIIDSRNFEEYNYFPSGVLVEGRESFISFHIYCFKDLLLLVGCYWSLPDEIYVMELESKKVIRLDNYIEFDGLMDYEIENSSIKVYENGFALMSEENPKEYLLEYDKLKEKIKKYGSLDFDIE